MNKRYATVYMSANIYESAETDICARISDAIQDVLNNAALSPALDSLPPETLSTMLFQIFRHRVEEFTSLESRRGANIHISLVRKEAAEKANV